MNLQEILDTLHLQVLTEPKDFSVIPITSGYTSDMLSCVVNGANSQGIWVTLMAHNNVVAVASLIEIPAIIITENTQPEAATIALANEKEIVLITTPKSSFEIAGLLWEMGLRAT